MNALFSEDKPSTGSTPGSAGGLQIRTRYISRYKKIKIKVFRVKYKFFLYLSNALLWVIFFLSLPRSRRTTMFKLLKHKKHWIFARLFRQTVDPMILTLAIPLNFLIYVLGDVNLLTGVARIQEALGNLSLSAKYYKVYSKLNPIFFGKPQKKFLH